MPTIMHKFSMVNITLDSTVSCETVAMHEFSLKTLLSKD